MKFSESCAGGQLNLVLTTLLLDTPSFPVQLGKENKTEKMSGKIQLQRHVDLTSSVMIIVGAIVGSGIYISPKGTFYIFNDFGPNKK